MGVVDKDDGALVATEGRLVLCFVSEEEKAPR
jgi:hypothetical protein